MAKRTALVIGANGDLGSAVIAELSLMSYITIGTTRQDGETMADFTLHALELFMLIRSGKLKLKCCKNANISQL